MDNPDQTIQAPVTECQHCQSDLTKVEPEKVIRRQVIEIPQVLPFIIETQQHEVLCPHCQQLNRGILPAGLEADRFFGPNLAARVVYYKFQLERDLDELLSRAVHNQAARNLKERFLTHRDKLQVFLHDPDVPPTNNESERELRTSVIHRKVTNCFRSEWGAKAYAALQSVIATARFKGDDIFDALVKLIGKPIDQYLQPSSP